MVLRVSSRMAPVPAIASTYARVSVAMPDRCCTVLSALRSAASIARALPSRRSSTVPAATRSPSLAQRSIRTSPSSARKKAMAISSPASVIGSRQFIVASKRASGSIVARLVTSPPDPRSSASTRRTKSARSKCAGAPVSPASPCWSMRMLPVRALGTPAGPSQAPKWPPRPAVRPAGFPNGRRGGRSGSRRGWRSHCRPMPAPRPAPRPCRSRRC